MKCPWIIHIYCCSCNHYNPFVKGIFEQPGPMVLPKVRIERDACHSAAVISHITEEVPTHRAVDILANEVAVCGSVAAVELLQLDSGIKEK